MGKKSEGSVPQAKNVVMPQHLAVVPEKPVNPLADMADVLKQYTGKALGILCMRYWYRGIVSLVGADFVVLSNARAVEQTGAAASERPTSEDAIPCDVTIMLDAIELIAQPEWVHFEIEETKEKVVTSEASARAEKLPTRSDLLRENFLGQPLAILCMRYWYRGIVKSVGSNFVVLSHAFAVEQTGASANPTTMSEDKVGSEIIVNLDAIELFGQLGWVWDKMPTPVK